MARRLVERGVPYVTINYKGWDTHKQHFQIMRRKLPEMDQGMATLLAGPLRARAAGQHDRLVERRVRADARRSSGRRPGTAAAATTARSSPPWSPAAGSRAARSSALGRQGRGGRGAARLSVRPDRQHVRAAGHRPDGRCRTPTASSASLDARRRRKACLDGRPPEGDSVSAKEYSVRVTP